MVKTRLFDGWASRPSVSANHRLAGRSLHQRAWSDDACTTTQRRPWPCHELAWSWIVFLSEQSSGDQVCENSRWACDLPRIQKSYRDNALVVIPPAMWNVERRAKSSGVDSGSTRTVTERATAYATVLWTSGLARTQAAISREEATR